MISKPCYVSEWFTGVQQTLSVSIELDCVAWFVDSVVFFDGFGIIVLVLDDGSLILFDEILDVHHTSEGLE